MKQVNTKLCQSLHILPVASLPFDIVLGKGEHQRVRMFSFFTFFFLFLTVFGTLAAEFEVLVFACQNGDRNLNMCC